MFLFVRCVAKKNGRNSLRHPSILKETAIIKSPCCTVARMEYINTEAVWSTCRKFLAKLLIHKQVNRSSTCVKMGNKRNVSVLRKRWPFCSRNMSSTHSTMFVNHAHRHLEMEHIWVVISKSTQGLKTYRSNTNHNLSAWDDLDWKWSSQCSEHFVQLFQYLSNDRSTSKNHYVTWKLMVWPWPWIKLTVSSKSSREHLCQGISRSIQELKIFRVLTIHTE